MVRLLVVFEWQIDSATFPESAKHSLLGPPSSFTSSTPRPESSSSAHPPAPPPHHHPSTRLFTKPLSLFSHPLFTPPSLPSVPSLFAVRCGGCAQAVSPAELVMRAQASVFHLRCFTCSVCSCRLRTGDRCVLRDGQLLCAREDYHRCLASPTSSDTGNLLLTMCRLPRTRVSLNASLRTSSSLLFHFCSSAV